MPRLEDLTGRKFGRLRPTRHVGGSVWECICDCGVTRTAPAQHLKRGAVKSCGCLYSATRTTTNRKHGERRSIEYRTWLSARERCANPNHVQYKNYGGRGIKMCERWNSFANFLADMGRKLGPKYSIERNDVDGDYCPENCRWATSEEQSNNKTNSYRITIDGETKTVQQWTRYFGVPRGRIRQRLKLGWTPEQAFGLKPKKRWRRGNI